MGTINDFTEDTTPSTTDFLLTWDVSANANKKVTLANVVSGGGAITSLADLGVTASAAELNILDGATLSTTELNYVDGVTSPIQTQLDGKEATIGYTTARRDIEINTQTDDYTLVLGDAGKYIRMNKATAVDLTVPLNSSVAFPVGTQIVIRQVDAQVTVVATGGVTINTAETLLLRKEGSTASLIKVATDEWDLTGDLEEV
jgi:acyl-coenzyme A thioesterase PaaI-like protein